jgi:hypothetical protein
VVAVSLEPQSIALPIELPTPYKNPPAKNRT